MSYSAPMVHTRVETLSYSVLIIYLVSMLIQKKLGKWNIEPWGIFTLPSQELLTQMYSFFIEAMNKPNHIHALIWKSKNIMNITDIPSGCVSPMWSNIMNINDCNTWQLSATCYGYRVRIEKFVIWYTEDIICFAFATLLNIRGYGYDRFVNAVL